MKELDNGMEFILCIPKWEMIYSKIVIPTVVLLGILLGISILMVSCLYAGLKGNILKPIGKLIYIANKIGRGENDVEIKIDKPEEFAKLASTFDKMTKDIKTVTKENERINSELSIAHSIQASSLPDKFPAFPDNDEFDIFASMKPAKEIGGDFYDFYFIDDDNLMFLIADVSGKGVPAALFMMTVKTLISNLSQLGYSPKDLAKTINKKMCENNKRGFFVTMLTGIVNIKTGNIYLINCGHNKPLIKRKGAVYEYVDLPSNIALGVFENSDFEIYETSLAEGDILFTYTDGITEALNSNEEMYGEERLIEVLNKNSDLSDIKGIASSVGKNVEEYAQQIPQSDDITMLIFSYKNGRIKTFKTSAKIENYKPFYSWLHEILTEWNIDNELINKIDMCSEEIFANIAFYAYPEKNGDMEVSISKNSDKIKLVFKDEGIPYNPLEKQDPDITLPPEERPVGGLGIYMVKQMADSVSYEYMNGQNILTIIISV